MPKIKVLHIITRLDKGGSAQNTLDTVDRLDKNRFEAYLASGPTHDPQGEISAFISQKKINYTLIPELVREISPVKDIAALARLYGFIRENKFDIVHTHTSKAGIAGRWAAKLAGVKIIVHTPHGHVFYGYFGRFKTGLFIFLEKITAAFTDKIITLTQRGKEEHVKFGIAGPGKFIPVYSGINVGEFIDFKADVPGQKDKLQIPAGVPVIGTVSRFDPVKGNRYFISALPQVIKEFPGLRAICIGEGSEKKEMQDYVNKSGLAKNVIFMGNSPDVRAFLSTLDIFVLPSLNEGMGRVLLEAQAMGVPVVAANVGGVPDVVKDGVTGILVPPADSQSLARAIIGLLKDEIRRKSMAQEARKWVDRRFSVEAMVGKISGIYESLVNKFEGKE